MARSSVLLLVLAAAAASGPGDAAEARGYQPEALATSVALFCATRLPTVPCCQTLARSARAGCLRRLAAAPPLVAASLNATDLLRLYAACPAPAYGGAAAPALAPAPRYDGGSGAGDATAANAAAVGAADGPSCAPGTLALQMGLFCDRSGSKAPPGWACCEAVVAAVGMGAGGDPSCFCRAAQGSGLSVRGVVGLYAACGGLRTGLAGHLAKTCPKA